MIEEIMNTGFIKHNNYHIEEITDEYISLRVDLTENSMNPFNMAHGGLIFGLGDTVMGLLATREKGKAVTLSSNINYLRPGIGKYLIAKGKLIKTGKTTAYLKTDIYNDKEELIATMDSNYFFLVK